ncbi:GAF domain-containing sensor histidine kinase [Pedobacter sp. SAFR-022]|uniref:GAF domain-containing sensor histidine kinase n=1 Tax=Pedobacter sp. SAFR-022 TaxID=3436861 RepID=UPI003F801E98
MANKSFPIPDNELERIIALSNIDLDFTNLEENFKDLTLLATKVTGTEISLINIIDSFTQWTIANQGIELEQMPREESVCQYTIMSDTSFEVQDLTLDERFSTKFYVKGPEGLRYYFGMPLKLSPGLNVGALCVLDKEVKALSAEKIELLEIIAQTVVKRLKSIQALELLRAKLNESNASKKKAAHDIRGPLGGIIGLSDLIAEQGATFDVSEFMEYINMINKSGRSLLDLADEILSEEKAQTLAENEFNLPLFKDKLLKLYQPQAKFKNVDLEISLNAGHESVPFSKNKLLQIAGNLISNAIKFTAAGGKVSVHLGLSLSTTEKLLTITVTDTGVGLDTAVIQQVLAGKAQTTIGTGGERGYGFGLSLVSHLVESLNGLISVNSAPGKGTAFEVVLPQSL